MSHEFKGRLVTAIITGVVTLFISASSFYYNTQSDIVYMKVSEVRQDDTLKVHEIRLNKHDTDIAVINAKLDNILRGIEEIKKQIK